MFFSELSLTHNVLFGHLFMFEVAFKTTDLTQVYLALLAPEAVDCNATHTLLFEGAYDLLGDFFFVLRWFFRN